MTQYLTIPEAAVLLNTSERFVADELRRKRMRGAKTGAGWRLAPADIDAYAEAHMNVSKVRKAAS